MNSWGCQWRRLQGLLILIATLFAITSLSGVLISWVAGSLRSRLSVGKTSSLSMKGDKSSTLVKDPKDEWSAFQATRWLYSKAWAAAKLRLVYSLAPAERDASHGEPSEMSVGNGDEALGSMFTHTN